MAKKIQITTSIIQETKEVVVPETQQTLTVGDTNKLTTAANRDKNTYNWKKILPIAGIGLLLLVIGIFIKIFILNSDEIVIITPTDSISQPPSEQKKLNPITGKAGNLPEFFSLEEGLNQLANKTYDYDQRTELKNYLVVHFAAYAKIFGKTKDFEPDMAKDFLDKIQLNGNQKIKIINEIRNDEDKITELNVEVFDK
jgi:hypothetical protein